MKINTIQNTIQIVTPAKIKGHLPASIVASGTSIHTFQFDHVFGPTALQQNVYTTVAQPLILDMTRGINACILAYGQVS